MPTTGLTIHDDCNKVFKQFKSGTDIKYITFKIEDEQMLVDQSGAPGADYYERFLASFPANEPRYGVLDFGIEKPEGTAHKTLFYAWSPDESDVKLKMLYALNLRAFRKLFIGPSIPVQCADLADINFDEVLERATVFEED
ncbi:hypothetical protein BJV82DRAFT_616926 [Fennellomyces sp. T-0311]|nr:hypothetical protein BJV82DRAFT_616926 [Fennellomyces sp. T-0311]